MERRSPVGSTRPGQPHLRRGGHLPHLAWPDVPSAVVNLTLICHYPDAQWAAGPTDWRPIFQPVPARSPLSALCQRVGQPFRLQPLRRALPALRQPLLLLHPLGGPQGLDPNRARPEQFSSQDQRRRPGLGRSDERLYPRGSIASLMGGSHD